MATEITILSGKGGAGKTVITAALASIAENAVFCDNDVDAADLHLIFKPKRKETHRFDSGTFAVIDPELCTGCNLCIDNCRFSAIGLGTENKPEINPLQCEGCRLCERLCPESAIQSVRNNDNYWFVSDSRFGRLVHAQMGPGEENSGKLVTQIRNKAREIASDTNADFILNDGPPGIGCTAISAVTGADIVLLVAEPSVSGLHDLERLFRLTSSFKIPAFAVINKYDVNREKTTETENFLKEHNIPLLARLPFEPDVVKSIINGKSIVEFIPDSRISDEIRLTWQLIKQYSENKHHENQVHEDTGFNR